MGELKCLVELNKQGGILIKLKNPDDGIEQSVVLDGNSITTTCMGGSDTSTIVQKCDSVAITCKNFSVEADNIKMHSKQKAEHLSDGSIKLKSATQTDMESTTINISGNAAVNVKGGIIKLQ